MICHYITSIIDAYNHIYTDREVDIIYDSTEYDLLSLFSENNLLVSAEHYISSIIFPSKDNSDRNKELYTLYDILKLNEFYIYITMDIQLV